MGQRLLIVDGDRRFIKDHQAALEAAFDVNCLHTTDGVMPLLESGDFAAVLICVEVSENKGYAICSAIRKNPKLANLKVALISAKATEEEYARHRSLKGKADLYLHKPLISSALIASLSPLVPPRTVDPDNPLGDLSGADLGDEWLDSLKADLDPADRRDVPRIPQVPQPSRPTTKEPPARSAPGSMATVSIPLPAALPRVAPIPPESGKVELLETRVRDLEAKLQDRGELLSRREQELNDLRIKHDSVTRNLDDLEQQRRDADLLQQKLKEAETRARSLEAEVVRCEDMAAALRKSEEEAQSDRQRLQDLVKDMERRFSDKEKEASESRQSMEQRIQELQSRSATQIDLELQLAEARENQARQQARYEEVQSQIEAKTRDLTDKQREIDSYKADVAGLEATLRGQRRELADQGGRLSSLTRDCESLQSKLAQQEMKCAELTREINMLTVTHDNQLQELTKAVQERDASLDSLKANQEALKRRIIELESDKRTMEGHLNERSARLEALTGAISDLESNIRRASDLTRPF